MTDKEPSGEGRKSVGIYDRPAGADRPRLRTLGIILLVLAVVVASLLYFTRT